MGNNMARKIYTVVGATGSVGRELGDVLQAHGHEVRPVARRAGVAFEDPVALDRAFAGADGAYLMIPFDFDAPDLHRREAEIGARLAGAVAKAAVPRVVLLSGLSAHLGDSTTGSAIGAALMEKRLDSLNIPELVHLRAGFFMENLLQGVGQIAQTGTFCWAFASDRPMPMIAASDVGKRAAELLMQEKFDGRRVEELHGAGDHTLAEAVRILGASIGRPHVLYKQIPYAEARRGMIEAGISESFADAVMVTARNFNDGLVWAKEKRSPGNTTETTLGRFASEVFAKAYHSAAPGQVSAAAQ
jgi:uncharacterized protein YbjT (DUF2867 family)